MRVRRPLEFLIPGGFGLSVLACAAVALTLPAPEVVPRAVVMGAVVAAYALWSRSVLAGLATGVMAWCFTTGFLVNAAGELTFTPGDLVRLTAFLALGLGGGVPRAARARRRRTSRQPGQALSRTPVADAS
ncbi:hypothetical protein [Nonomuraea zeae]|uniref:DUF4118 domain-containing protein n=1 Tax=Nonomuraea zeae TaxID=1642303 RepID=A0A5S4GNE3_9ACTN|nr:hypothetical protein [Nonomuraea zeae]TMR34302.1 hypothetical protein ETD85_17190 [Nonomuraea zeae]